jgi:hypothetical protein
MQTGKGRLKIFKIGGKHNTRALLTLESGGCAVNIRVKNIEKFKNILRYKLLEIAGIANEKGRGIVSH